MEIYNLDKYINRLISGIIYLTYQEKIYQIRPASIFLRQQADLYYDFIINTYKNGVKTEKIFLEYCIEKNMLDSNYKDLIESDRKQVEGLKIALFKAGPRISVAEKIRKSIQIKKKQQNDFLEHIYELKSNTLEGIAEHAKKTYMFLNSIYDEDEYPIFKSQIYEEDNIDVNLYNFFTQKYGEEILGEKTLRAIARSSTWRSLWNNKKQSIFKNDFTELTEEQRLIATYSELYDFAYQHEKAPSQKIIDDNDLFDGWYLVQVKKFEDEKAGRDSDESMGKFNPNHSEIFIIAKDQEEANSIYNSNSDESKKILKARAQVLKEKGSARDLDLPDVRHELRLQSSEMFRKNMNSKNNN